MKILFCATVDSHIQHFHTRIIHQLHEMGNTIDLVSNGDYSNADIHEKFNIPFSRTLLSSDNLIAYRSLKRILRDNHYDCISCHTPIASFLVRYASRKYPKTYVIYTAHGFHFYRGCARKNELLFRNAERIAAKYTDTLVTINQQDYAASQQFCLKKGGRCVYIPGVGVNLREIDSRLKNSTLTRSMLGLLPEDTVMLSVGETNENKNHLFVIRSMEKEFHQNPHLKYLICGDGKLFNQYQEEIRNRNLSDQVVLLGFRKDVIEILGIADIFVFPSLREGFPLSIMEAMACGVPVIASRIRGNEDLIEDEINGFTYAVNDQKDFLRKINQMIANPALRQKFKDASKTKVAAYSSEIIDKQILALYDHVLTADGKV